MTTLLDALGLYELSVLLASMAGATLILLLACLNDCIGDIVTRKRKEG